MQTYREKLLNDISHLDEEQSRKFYHFFQLVKREFLSSKGENWKNEFQKISAWTDKDLEHVSQGFKNWKIPEY